MSRYLSGGSKNLPRQPCKRTKSYLHLASLLGVDDGGAAGEVGRVRPQVEVLDAAGEVGRSSQVREGELGVGDAAHVDVGGDGEQGHLPGGLSRARLAAVNAHLAHVALAPEMGTGKGKSWIKVPSSMSSSLT